MRLTRYVGVGISTFLLDLSLLYMFVEVVNLNYIFSTIVAFVFAVSVNYSISRTYVFAQTERSLLFGYMNFMSIMCTGLILTTSFMYVAVDVFMVHYLVARITIAGFVGFSAYLVNLHYNFMVAGR